MAAEPDFDLQMRSLAEEAQQHADVEKPAEKLEPAVPEALRPLVAHLELLGRAVRENTMAIMRIDESIAAQSNIAGLPRLITTLHEDLENKNGVSQKLFDALHDELRGYKDGFLLEVLHRPLIRDLILLYDDLSEIHRRTAAFVATLEGTAKGWRLQLPGVRAVESAEGATAEADPLGVILTSNAGARSVRVRLPAS